MKIVTPPFWYCVFWIVGFLPAFGVTLYLVARFVLPLYESAMYRAVKRALDE